MATSEHTLPAVADSSLDTGLESIAAAKSSWHDEQQNKKENVISMEFTANQNGTVDSQQWNGFNAGGSMTSSHSTNVENDLLNTVPQNMSQNHGPNTSSDIINEDVANKNFLLAANYIEDAKFGRTLEYNTDEGSLLSYRYYSKFYFHWLTIFVLWLLLFLALFEDPAVPSLGLPYWATLLMELPCLAVIIFRLYSLSRFVPRRTFLTDPKNIVVAATLLITFIDIIVYIAMMESSAKDNAIRVSRVLRPLFFINMNESRQVRRAFRNIRNTVPEIMSVLILFIFSISLFTLLAFKLFQFRGLKYRGGESYFTNYLDGFFDLYVLVTTANSPDVMMPAYDYNSWFVLFFIAYIIVNTYIFINLFLAVIYNSYRTHLKTEIRSSIIWKRKRLERAFEILKESNENPVVTHATWIRVMKNLAKPPSYAKTNFYWEVLNYGKGDESTQSTSHSLTLNEFQRLDELLNVNLLVKKASVANIFLQWAPDVYRSDPSVFLRKCVNHKIFVYVFDILIIANAICIGVDLESSEWFFLSVFMLEIILKMYTLGPREYFSFERPWNWFDFTIIMAAFITTIIEASLNELSGLPREALDFLMVLRCLRLIKIVGTIEKFHVIVMTVVNIAPSLATYGVVLLLIYYSFAIIGMECFGGLIEYKNDGTSAIENMCGNELLKDSEFLRVGYCNNNFNDILHSLVVLIELTVVNQWHIITLGYSLVTSKAARLYFVTFHLIVVILIMNIIVAFVLEAFILEYSISQTPIETAVEKTIASLGMTEHSNAEDVNPDRAQLVNEIDDANIQYYDVPDMGQQNLTRMRFSTKKGHKNVEALLHRMFEDELEQENNSAVPKREPRLTLDGVTETAFTT